MKIQSFFFPNAVYSTARGSQISGSIHCHLPSSPPGRAIAPPQWWATRLAPPPRPSPGSLSRWSRSNSRHPWPGSESHAASRVPEFRASECSKKKQATLPCLPGYGLKIGYTKFRQVIIIFFPNENGQMATWPHVQPC